MIIRINLLDWRAQRRETRKRQFNAMLAVAFTISAGLVLLSYLLASGAVDRQNLRNDYLRQQIAEVDLKIKEIQELEKVKRNLLSRMRVIEQLQASRSATVHFFDELVNTLPEGVSLTTVKQTGAGVVIEGVAESNARVSAYMKNLDASTWFDDPKLVVIKTTEKNSQRQSEFTLQVRNLTKPPSDTPDETLE
ncbi:type IV pilus assembly protein PilN [Hydrocarboniphaga daqingensis]|jgi:type IV pilus assembly protein PilN|uniref:Type IV pilus assembly protein PilN n=1 Tax=Hydrocarboniphaga daqingensis TaxID=490188 RepID=A0A1M5L9Z1_9GAMM|nr:PilN domain-containing protein [Hydrocarboniphaga daqingensis]SHG61847.1 type IV pilus assembly protein PilN [Hydrocarboniphaga daqingensis]